MIIGSGTALVRGGPLGLFLGYSFVGLVCILVMIGLGEMATYLPHKKGFASYATRFVDPALGKSLIILTLHILILKHHAGKDSH